MAVINVSELKPFENRTVVAHLNDGEIATVKIAFVDAEYEDIIVDIVTTNRPEAYKRGLQDSA